MLHLHLSFTAWAAVLGAAAAVIGARVLGGLVRRHLARLAGSAAFGLVAAAGVTGWADAHGHAKLAAVAARRAAAGHQAGVSASLAAGFITVAVLAGAAAFTAASVTTRLRARARYAQYDEYAALRRGHVRDW
jgi:hypothetical protein